MILNSSNNNYRSKFKNPRKTPWFPDKIATTYSTLNLPKKLPGYATHEYELAYL